MKPIGLKLFREEIKLSQNEAAAKLGITQDYLSSIERRKRNPSLKLMVKMAKLYNKNPEEIFLAVIRTKCS